MTWYWDPSGRSIDVYDHTGTKVAADRSFSGSWPEREFPQEVLEVMNEEVLAALDSGDTQYVLETFRHAAFELIERGRP